MTHQTTSSQTSARSGPNELVWKSTTTVDNNGDKPQYQASSQQDPEEEQPLEEYVPEEDSDERHEQLAERCIRLMEEHQKKKESLAMELGFTLEEVEAMCENHTPKLISAKKTISGWNRYVSESRNEELAAANANGENLISETIGEYIKHYSSTYDAETRMIYTQKAKRCNLETGLKGYVAPHDTTEKVCNLRLSYVMSYGTR
ncbi:hypothetical protein INT45_001791 [Circinella minor]|uniref:Uncharacterized protein n=1 Tax=Circinella minor TaxID=1195481 RepID=A0A8H7RCK1_9FUNG|nr:hypothetical protein INT45_001791 [Circinella minor]